MTREDAIEVLNMVEAHGLADEAKKMAIQALQEPTGDMVSRQAVLDALKNASDIAVTCGAVDEEENKRYLPEMIRWIKGFPSVVRENRTGHWIEYTRVLIPEPINKWEQAWYCSECGYGNQECEDGSAWLEWAYCPNCGAKMKGKQTDG